MAAQTTGPSRVMAGLAAALPIAAGALALAMLVVLAGGPGALAR